MALSLFFDHRTERLADALCERVSRPSAEHPLARHSVVVPSIGVGRWLQQQMALRTGVCALLEPVFAGRLLWSSLRELMPALPARSPFDPPTVRWRLLAIFEHLPDAAAELAPLRERLGSATPAQRLAIADELAGLFDRYLAWRRDWLQAWERGELLALGPHEGWQAWLWRRLLASMPGLADTHPYERFETLIAREPQTVRSAFAGRRLSVFGMPGLSPAQFALFGLLGEVVDVAFFVPDPCREWWGDLVDSRTRARVLAMRPDEAWLYDGEPSVLGDWGRAQRDYVAQVAELQERFGVQAHEPFRALEGPDDGDARDASRVREARGAGDDAAAPRDCLHALRSAVFLRSDEPWTRLAGADDSIAIHAAHSALRQAEVLHDRLLDCFARLPGLHPSEVAVFCADVETAAAAIEAVFGSVGIDDARRIPVAISGRSPRTEPLLRAVLELPGLAAAGPDLPSVEGWLLNPAVAEATGLSGAEVAQLVPVFDAAGARWGLDASDGAAKHGWQDAFERLLVGAAVSDDVDLIGDFVPVGGLRGSRAAQLEPVLRLFDALRRLRALASAPRPVADWCRQFGALVDELFGSTRLHEPALARVRDALADLAQAADEAGGQRSPGATGAPPAKTAIDAQAFRRALEQALADSAPAASASGAVTVCPLGALRGVPFRVVCLFGLDEGAFPRRGPRSEADLMLRAPRFGDRQARSEERGVFLDALLAARDRLLVLFRGRDARDDSELNPSPVVLELLGYLRDRLGVGPEAPLRRPMPAIADATAIVEHPLHPFAPRAFAADADGSHAIEWLAAARSFAEPLAGRSGLAGPLVPAGAYGDREAAAAVAAEGSAGAAAPAAREASVRDPGEVAFDDLRLALADPIPYWLRKRLGLALPQAERLADATEPLWPGETDERALLETAARTLLAGGDPGRLAAALAAAPTTAGAAVGRRQAGSLVERAERLVAAAGGAGGAPGHVDVDFAIDAQRSVRARLELPQPDGVLRMVSAWKLNLHGIVDAWLRHALLAAWLQRTGRSDALVETVLAADDARARIAVADPTAALGHAIDVFDGLQTLPPPALPRAWLAAWRSAWGKQRPEGTLAELLRSGDPRGARARDKLEATMLGAFRDGGELAKPWQAAYWRDAQPAPVDVLEAGDRLWTQVMADVTIEDSK